MDYHPGSKSRECGAAVCQFGTAVDPAINGVWAPHLLHAVGAMVGSAFSGSCLTLPSGVLLTSHAVLVG